MPHACPTRRSSYLSHSSGLLRAAGPATARPAIAGKKRIDCSEGDASDQSNGHACVKPLQRDRDDDCRPNERLTVFFHRSSVLRSEEHTSELQSLMRISYAVF